MEQHEINKLEEVRANLRRTLNSIYVYLWKFDPIKEEFPKNTEPDEWLCRYYLMEVAINPNEPGPWTPKKPNFPWEQDGSEAYTGGGTHGSAQRGEDSQAAEPTEEQFRKLVEQIDDVDCL